jgi:hypothetical protein
MALFTAWLVGSDQGTVVQLELGVLVVLWSGFVVTAIWWLQYVLKGP